jgi:hypothetical protein
MSAVLRTVSRSDEERYLWGGDSAVVSTCMLGRYTLG